MLDILTQMRGGNLKGREFHHLWRSTYLRRSAWRTEEEEGAPLWTAGLRVDLRRCVAAIGSEIFKEPLLPYWAADNGPLVAENQS